MAKFGRHGGLATCSWETRIDPNGHCLIPKNELAHQVLLLALGVIQPYGWVVPIHQRGHARESNDAVFPVNIVGVPGWGNSCQW